jgi:purine-nucleoside phosphorylase
MPKRLRPKTELAERAILVGDPGRSLLLAQELLVEPKMSNHARGLWGYTDRTAAGDELTIQATGMGGPSAALVLADLAKLGVKRVVRVGTCAAVVDRADLGELLLPNQAVAGGGSAASFGLQSGESVSPDRVLLEGLAGALAANARTAVVTSVDIHPADPASPPTAAVAADMQTVAVLAQARPLGIAAAAVLIVSEAGGGQLDDEALDALAGEAGAAAALALSNPQVEG